MSTKGARTGSTSRVAASMARPSPTPASTVSGPSSTPSSRRRGPATSDACLPSSTRTSCCAPTAAPWAPSRPTFRTGRGYTRATMDTDAADERATIARLRAGDAGGLEPLVRAHQLRATRAAYLVLHDRSLAEEVVQGAFLKAFERIDQFDPDRRFAPWFLASVLHDAVKAARRRDRHRPLDALAGPDGGAAGRLAGREPTPEERWERAETAAEVRAALAELPAPQRAAVVARYYLGLSEADAAMAFDCPAGTLKWRLHAARARLRLLLQPSTQP